MFLLIFEHDLDFLYYLHACLIIQYSKKLNIYHEYLEWDYEILD